MIIHEFPHFDKLNPEYKVNPALHKKEWFNNELKSVPEPKETFYSDGSKNENTNENAAASLHIKGKEVINKITTKLHPLNDINDAEMIGIYNSFTMAQQYINANPELISTNFVFCTDSQNTIEHLNSTKNHNALIEDIAETTKTYKQHTFHWIYSPAHVGITGNEMADKEAKATTTNDELTPIAIITKTLVKQSIKHLRITSLHRIYTQTHSEYKNRTIAAEINELKHAIWYRPKKEIMRLQQWRLGVGPIEANDIAHLYEKEDRNCPICKKPKTV